MLRLVGSNLSYIYKIEAAGHYITGTRRLFGISADKPIELINPPLQCQKVENSGQLTGGLLM
jgi:hypothetical protein